MKSHDLILIRKGSFNETIDPKTFHVQYKQIVSPTCGYIVSVKTFDERHWQQREGILKRRSCQKTLLEIHPCNSFSSTYKPTKASICRIEGEKTTHPETNSNKNYIWKWDGGGIRSCFLFWGAFFVSVSGSWYQALGCRVTCLWSHDRLLGWGGIGWEKMDRLGMICSFKLGMMI